MRRAQTAVEYVLTISFIALVITASLVFMREEFPVQVNALGEDLIPYMTDQEKGIQTH